MASGTVKAFEKVVKNHFFEFFSCFASRVRSRAAKPAKCENLWFSSVFTHTPQGAFSCPCGAIHLVSPNPNKAIRDCGPLTTPRLINRPNISYA